MVSNSAHKRSGYVASCGAHPYRCQPDTQAACLEKKVSFMEAPAAPTKQKAVGAKALHAPRVCKPEENR